MTLKCRPELGALRSWCELGRAKSQRSHSSKVSRNEVFSISTVIIHQQKENNNNNNKNQMYRPYL